MKHRIVGLAAMAALVTLLLRGAHAQTKMVGKADVEKSNEGPPRKILVLAVATDPISRASYEDVIAGEIALRGANAVASHVPFPELPKERGPFEAKLKESGFDAVMVSRLVGSEDKVKMTEGYDTYATDYQGMDYWGGYWYTYEKVFVPGYLQNVKKVRVRTDLWRTVGGTGQLVWSGTSETLNPRTAAQAGKEIGSTIAKALAKAKLI